MNQLTRYVLAALIGSSVGFVGGFQGIAGGFYISMLLLASGMYDTQRKAAGTTLLAIVFPLSIGAVYEYWKTDDIDIPSGLIITLFYIIFSWLGAIYNKEVDDLYVYGSLAVSVFLTSVYFFHQFLSTLHKNKKM
jgi:uncharacterized membrane protein YfcA